MRKHLLLIGASIGIVATFAGCASTQYSQYSGSPVMIGQGGANHNINGIDFWIYGTPNRPYQIIGYIQDSRGGRPLAMAGRERGIAALALAQGADAIIIQSDNNEFMGAISNGFANGSIYNGNFSMNGFSTTIPIIRRNSTFLAIKYVNSAMPKHPPV
jgi:hypothetical protein